MQKERKAEKKEKKFKDLFVTWDPPSMEMDDMDLGDQDWLLGSTRNLMLALATAEKLLIHLLLNQQSSSHCSLGRFIYQTFMSISCHMWFHSRFV